MNSFDQWPFDDVRSVERRGDLEVLQGISPDGVPVTITRLAPDVADRRAAHERFRLAVQAATRQAGADDPPVLWADTAALNPWAATHDDPHRRGAALLSAAYQSVGAPPGAREQQPYGPPWPPRAPGDPQVSGQRSRLPWLLAFGAGGVVLVLLLGVAVSLGLTREVEALDPPTQEPVPTESVRFTPGPSVTYTSASPTTPPEPKLKDRKPVSVYGPVWRKGEKTFTMNFYQLGWSFRAPGDFDCFVGNHTKTRTKITCTRILNKLKNDLRGMVIVDRQCSDKSCSAAERKTCRTDHTGQPVKKLKPKDATTQYRTKSFTDQKTKRKGFALAMVHYYKGKSGHQNKCVLTLASGAVGKEAKQMQKTVNDIRTQTG